LSRRRATQAAREQPDDRAPGGEALVTGVAVGGGNICPNFRHHARTVS
jgi:hypothetical protein